MKYTKEYKDQRELVILSFNNYLVTAEGLFNARQTSNKTACILLQNHLDKHWEEWELATNNMNDLLMRELKIRA